MNFLYPGLLVGLLLGAIPILVYYLMRFRATRIAWGADYILERALARRRRKIYWDQVILLALRALAVMAIVAAFARPQSRNKELLSTGGSVLRILLIDNSYSTLAGRNGQTVRDQAFDAARALVARWPKGEKWSLYALDSNPRWVVDQARVVDPARTLAILEALKIEETAVSLAAGLKTVLGHGSGQQREIYIFSDDQASAWDGAEQMAAGKDDKTKIFWIRPPLPDYKNLGVTALASSHESVLRGHTFPVFAQVANFSDEAVRDAELTFLVNGVAAGAKRISLPPGQNTQVAMDLRIAEAGPHLLTARLDHDVLPFDNAMSAGIEVINSVSVLVLRDADRAGKFDSSFPFLKMAARILAGNSTNEAAAPLRIKEHTTRACTLKQLLPHDAVILDGARTLTPELTATLKNYVAEGGGLILALDDTVDLAAWRRLLPPAGLLPAPIQRVRSEPLDGEACRRISRSGFDLPALRYLENCPDGDVSQVRFYTWAEFDAPVAGAEVMARFSDNAPYAFRQRLDRGCILMLAAGLNSRNNSMLVRETVYPFLVHLFAEAASAGQYRHVVGRHEAVRYLARGKPPVAAMFEQDKDAPVPATLTPLGSARRVEYAPGSGRSGPASLLILQENKSNQRVYFGIQGDRPDSCLTPMPDATRARLTELLGWTEVASARDLMAALEAQGQGMEFYAWVLLAVLLFALGELLMELRFV
jgi:hypothetical protein